MKYIFTTLAVGKSYLSNSLIFFFSLHEKTEHAHFNITTTDTELNNIQQYTGLTLNGLKSKYPRISISTIEQLNKFFKAPLHSTNCTTCLSFQFNYKALAVKACIELETPCDFLIYVDSDWLIHENFNEAKILDMCSYMNSQDIDFAYERPAKIGNYKKNNLHDCFFIQKAVDYRVMEHDVWDEADVVNEQFLVFKNNWKLRLFSMKWEQFLWYSIANDITGYAEGFEIGISALESKMKMSYSPLSLLTECFSFYSRYNTTERNVRF